MNGALSEIQLQLSQCDLCTLICALDTEIKFMESGKKEAIAVAEHALLTQSEYSYTEDVEDCDDAIESLQELRERLKEADEQYLLRSGKWDENAGPDHESL